MNIKPELNTLNYDVFPLVFKTNTQVEINIRLLGFDPEFISGEEYTLDIAGCDGGRMSDFPLTSSLNTRKIICENGGFKFTHLFESEQEYNLIFIDKNGETVNIFNVYAVDDDLAGRYPYMGDLHLHSYLSDGNELPEVVCANYRKYGYDFLSITDHRRYYPSLQAIEAYKDCPVELNIVQGEEVHLPPVNGKTNDIHIINFGGEYSINALIDGAAVKEKGKDLSVRAVIKDNVPDVMTEAEFSAKMEALAEKEDIPENVEKIPYTVCKWIFDEIRNANGLGIFAHPNWRRQYGYHSPEIFTDYMFEKKPFDAFEVLGGESYFEQNGFQTVRYYEECAKGHKVPIVGSTDSHSSYYTNKNAFICSTIVFSPENERTKLIESIKDYYSVAVDTISEEFRVIGESRLVRYATFLIKKYFPLHDDVCREEGRLMKLYVTGTEEEREEALNSIRFISGRTEKLMKKYIKF